MAGRRRARQGQAAVAFALCLPIVVVLVGLLIELMVYVHARNVVFAAAHEGAETASAEGGSLDDGYQRAQVVLRAGLGQYAGRLAVAGEETDDLVVIDVAGSLGALQLQPDPHTAIGLPLHARARSTRERVP
jgi:Flp pilus assembly protein TadG